MLPPFLVLFALLLTQKESAADFFSEEVMQKLRVSTKGLTLKARNALFFLAGIFMIVALAEPVIPQGKIEIEQKSADILVALDISNSMLATDIYPSRLEFAKKKAVTFIQRLQKDRVGVIAFAKGSYLVSPLSFDKEAVAFLLSNLDTSSITEQGTDFMALLETVQQSSQKSKRKYVLILSDGGDKEDFSKEIEYARKNGITVFVLGVGTKKGAPIRLSDGTFMKYKGKIVITRLNEHIADLGLGSGGVYIQATNSDKDIEAMRKEMRRVIEEKTLKKKTIEKHIPLFYIPLGAAMLLVLIALSSMTKRQKVHVPSSFVLFVGLAFLLNSNLHAGVLDFMELKEAKQAYESENYEAAAKRYEEYAKRSKKAQAYYDAGNAYYKAGKYKKAAEMYKHVHTKESDLQAKTFHNLGNTYAKMQRYKEAAEAYKDALKLKEDIQTKENLEAVKKLLKKRKQKQQKSAKKNQSQKKNKQQNKRNQNKQQSKEKKSDKNRSNEDAKKQNDKNGQKGDAKSSNAKKQEKKQKQEKSKPENAKKKQNKSDKKRGLQQLKEHDKQQKKQNKKQGAMPKIEHKEMKMSDAEEKKWLKELTKETKTFMYTIKPARGVYKGDEDEKPW